MPDTAVTSPNRTSRLRTVLRVVAVATALVVTVLAATPPEGFAQPPGADPPPGSAVSPPVRPPGAGVRAPGADYAWPMVPTPDVAQPFRAPSFRFGRGHRGADLAGAAGQAVLAAREGTVVFAGRVAGRPVVSVDHPDGLRTTYEPVVATVKPGDRPAVGDPLGVLVAGHAGCAVACLHWGVRRGKVDYLDPLVLVRPPRLRLLPWDGA
ncbi:M23 family metallopeptidase [Pseudonocardia endophytica]|uniref:Peptidase M23-like protein n=1 Tax=Pseudonocardia endophytica TaxID=401976 RepID=A0A4R1HX88_PSEEN|nr:M23 family metallopeptidase [Pseudonocardia endophytica]TCK25420.1 peptidase M23-like protein [Pseudonocardia endophytica]